MTAHYRAAYHHGDARAALIQAALDLARGGGPPRVTLRAAAREIGITAAAVYRHFTTVEELLEAVKGRASRTLADQLDEALAAAGGVPGRPDDIEHEREHEQQNDHEPEHEPDHEHDYDYEPDHDPDRHSEHRHDPDPDRRLAHDPDRHSDPDRRLDTHLDPDRHSDPDRRLDLDLDLDPDRYRERDHEHEHEHEHERDRPRGIGHHRDPDPRRDRGLTASAIGAGAGEPAVRSRAPTRTPSPDPTRIRAIAEAYLCFAREHPGLFGMACHGGVDAVRELVAERVGDVPRPTALAVWSAAHGVAVLSVPEADQQQVLDIVLAGIIPI